MAEEPSGPSRLPFVIDNSQHRLADVLRGVLREHGGKSLDVASAYFTVSGFRLLRHELPQLGSFRLLLGAEPASGEQLGLRPRAGGVAGLLRQELEDLPFAEDTLRLVEDLIAFLRRPKVSVRLADKGFLHAKCWLFYGDRPPSGGPVDRFEPLLAIVGSSNFTAPGLTSNRELNLVHKVLLDPAEVEDVEAAEAVAWLRRGPVASAGSAIERQLTKSEVGARALLDLEQWYQTQWEEGREFKDDLVEILAASKLGDREYTPYQVYLKALYEYFRDDLDEGALPETNRSAVELAEFQEDAVKKARRILARHHGVLVADSVGLGKTWIGKKLLEDFAYHQRLKAVVICPASLRANWQRELLDAQIAGQVLSQEELGRESFEVAQWRDVDLVLIDESHNFRNPNTRRYANLERLLAANGKRGKAGGRKKVILLTATPINNDLFDLYYQISLITLGDKGHFLGCGIGDLYRYFLSARRQAKNGGVTALYNLLEEVVIRRTRPFIRKAYPEATLQGQPIHFPERRLRSVRYDLEATYDGIYDEVVSGVESLKLAPYNLESYKKPGQARDDFEVGREQALVGIFKSRYLKRFESSIDAFRISVRRALEFLETFESYILDGRLLASSDFHRALRYLEREDLDDEVTPSSLADDFDAHEEARRFLESLTTIADTKVYDLRRLHGDLRHDVTVLTHIWQRVKGIDPSRDAKLEALRNLLKGELRGKKVLLFTYYRDTARYLYRQLGHPGSAAAQAFRAEIGEPQIRRLDSGADPGERMQIVQAFSPLANHRAEWAGSDREIQILISTDVLSEGQNLQDCGFLLNYDLHWNPTRMVQRAGRIDRIGTSFDTLWLYNMFPDEGLERLLRLVESLTAKIAAIDLAGFHDASLLGEGANPRNFNSLRRILDEDGDVLTEEEALTELPTNDLLAQQLRGVLEEHGRAAVEALPDGIHSGLVRNDARGAFFYLQAETEDGKQHFWRYVDLLSEQILDNRQLLAGLIACQPDTPRVVDAALWARIFELQERVVADILQSVETQTSLEVAPRLIEPVQQSAATVLQGALQHSALSRERILAALRFLSEPMIRADLGELRNALRRLQESRDLPGFLESIEAVADRSGIQEPSTVTTPTSSKPRLTRDQLRLICFEVISGG